MSKELTEALQVLNLKAIYWVDDDHAKPKDLDPQKLRSEVLLGIQKQGAPSIQRALGRLPDEWKQPMARLQRDYQSDEKKSPEERPDRTDQVAKKLDELLEGSPDEVGMLNILFESLEEKLTTPEKSALSSLFRPLAKDLGYTWQVMSFSDWERKQTSILADHDEAAPALVLLDQQNTTDSSSLNGTTILKSVCADEENRKAFKFLVVTNKCTQDQELSYGAELIDDVGVKDVGIKSPIFAVSKQWLTNTVNKASDGASLESHFVSLLRRLRLSLLNQQLTHHARKVINEATERAFERLTAITLHEFMYAVTQSSQIEGVSELDTLLRLVAIEQRTAMLEKVTTSSDLRQAIEGIRSTPVSIRIAELAMQRDLAGLRGREIYWPDKAVNKLHQPIAAGDIFEAQVDRHKKFYVLLANDCDIMMRGTDGGRNTTAVLLAEIVDEALGKEADAHLECPLVGHPKLERVRMSTFMSASPDVLDLCWLNEDGACVWNKREAYEELQLLGSQKERLKTLRHTFGDHEAVTRLVAVTNAVATVPMPFKRDKEIDFKLRRIARLNAPYAQGILSKFAGVFARPSYDHDYAKLRGKDTSGARARKKFDEKQVEGGGAGSPSKPAPGAVPALDARPAAKAVAAKAPAAKAVRSPAAAKPAAPAKKSGSSAKDD